MTAHSSVRKKLLLAMSGMTIIAMHGLTPAAATKQVKNKSVHAEGDRLRQDLRQIGEKVAKAVLDKDVPTLLSYDRADLRSADELALKNTKSSFYCFLFDSSCITWGGGAWRSVYDKLSRARLLRIQVKTANSPYDHKLYGSLLFYDRSSVSDRDLRSSEFLCDEQPTSLVSWNFKLEDGQWKAVTPLFDSETEGLCPEP
jgi:hypothetical protein